MNGSCLLFGIIFLIAGFVFLIGKGHEHIKAWQNMTEEEKAKVDIKPLCRNLGGILMLCGAIFLVSGFWAAFKTNCFAWAMLAWMVVTILDVIYIQKSDKYKLE
ncbi:MAG: DUF3784 domain-containing protein [Clostridiales bacterium]|nr:DUF3784 domain-containing protein [Clostridiales bacterium]